MYLMSTEIRSIEVRSMNKVQIRPARPTDLQAIVRIHMASFPNFFLSKLGPGFLQVYYSLIWHYSESLFFVAEDKGELTGFVAGFINPACFYRSLLFNTPRFIFPLLLILLKRPILLVMLLKNVRKVIIFKTRPDFFSDAICEIASIAVHPQFKNQGIGKELVREFIIAAQVKNIDQIRLYTDAKNNDDVNAFYRQLGFKLRGTKGSDKNRIINEYEFVILDK
jgi:ribosomal protein S18 acetylase RimI-like enzyme